MHKGDSGKTSSMGARTAKPFAVFFATIAFCLPTLGQTIGNKQLSRLHLSNQMRDQLVERFDLFIESEKTQSYDKQFELLAKEHLANLLHMDVTKESYVKFKQASKVVVGRLIELRVRRIKRIPNNPDWLSLSVVAKLQKGKTVYADSPICVAFMVDGNWRFSLLYIN